MAPDLPGPQDKAALKQQKAMTQPHLAAAILMAILCLQSACELWTHDAGDPSWRWWSRLLLFLFSGMVMWIEIRRGRSNQ
jgi:hypothetical protein